MGKIKLKSILFDFDGVLSNGRFYSTMSKRDKDIKALIYKKLFSKDSWETIKLWMSGDKSFENIHSIIASEVGTNIEFLNKNLIDSVIKMKLNQNMMKFASEVRKKEILVSIFTDNMDIFDRVFVPYNDLKSKFDYIFSSSVYKNLKSNNDGSFLKIAFKETGVQPKYTLLIDNSHAIGEFMNKFGGKFYLFEDYEHGFPAFEKWFYQNFYLDNG